MALKILCIDDEPDLLAMMKEKLDATGEFTVTTSTDPKNAENLVKEIQPDLILLDNIMPGRNGSDIAKQLKKKDSEFRRIPIIIVSGKGEFVYQRKSHEFKWMPNNPIVKTRGPLPDVRGAEALAKAFGVDDYVAKPFTMEVLIQVIKEVYQRTRKVEEKVEEI